MSADSQSGEPQIEFYRWPIFYSCFIKFVFRISGGITFEVLVEDSGTGGPSSIAVRIESLLTIFVPILICELLKNDEGESESIIR